MLSNRSNFAEFQITSTTCPNCGHRGMRQIYKVENVPVHSVLNMTTREMALNYPRGNVNLAFCENCGFISNIEFNPNVHEYSQKCEETQGFSPTFNVFSKKLAEQLIQKYNLKNKTVLEIGCGKGEFLTLLSELSGCTGIGFDPAYISERNKSSAKERLTFITDFYSEKYSNYFADVYICKMTLEHIQYTNDFLKIIRKSIGNNQDAIIFFQIPDMIRVLKDVAFWDIYYEHCSYFSPFSLATLFDNNDFQIMNIWTDYDDQYLMIDAKPGKTDNSKFLSEENKNVIFENTKYFYENFRSKIEYWKKLINDASKNKQRVVLWGSGSKGVAFLTTLKVDSMIEYVVDINPYRQGTYMPGTGHEIVSPEFLTEYKPDLVILMNPVYKQEVRDMLSKMGVVSKVITT